MSAVPCIRMTANRTTSLGSCNGEEVAAANPTRLWQMLATNPASMSTCQTGTNNKIEFWIPFGGVAKLDYAAINPGSVYSAIAYPATWLLTAQA
eukprot:5752222-Prymnesium_polylepis.1